MNTKIDAEGKKIVFTFPKMVNHHFTITEMEKDKIELIHQYVDNIGEVIHFGFEKRKINSVLVKEDMMVVMLGKEEEKENDYCGRY